MRILLSIEASNNGKLKVIGDVANKLYEKAMSGNTEAMILFLKCRIGWKEFRHTNEVKDIILDLSDKLPYVGYN